jgi:hypothetical protein
MGRQKQTGYQGRDEADEIVLAAALSGIVGAIIHSDDAASQQYSVLDR